ncbi:hypothetical protein [Paenibacillus alba]|uniref:hypothetical protein n=1 Tax=Paenibacillus alba TaxID=1197127 RepID=UPI001C207375|nr:hypothetical protein [Paenibacillus alba]
MKIAGELVTETLEYDGGRQVTVYVAGTLEPFFLENATRWAAALRDAGADVEMRERVASHDDVMWREEFPLMVAWAFGRLTSAEPGSSRFDSHLSRLLRRQCNP